MLIDSGSATSEGCPRAV